MTLSPTNKRQVATAKGYAAYLRHYDLVGREPGKCSDCGAHFPGMAHRPDCIINGDKP